MNESEMNDAARWASHQGMRDGEGRGDEEGMRDEFHRHHRHHQDPHVGHVEGPRNDTLEWNMRVGKAV